MVPAWIYAVVFVVPAAFTYNGISVNGNCSRSRPPEQFVVWGKPGPTLDCTLWGTNRCMDRIPHLQGNQPADPPSSLSVSGQLIPDPNDNSSPQITIEWEWQGAGPGNLEGFLLHIHTHNLLDNSLSTICRIFDFTASTISATNNKLTFQKKLIGFSGGSHLVHQLDLTSLPRNASDVGLTKYFTLQPVQEGSVIPARNWTPFISYDRVNFTAPATIEARFSLAASTYGFRQYRVMLESKNDSLNAVETCIISTNSSYFCQGREFDPPPENESTVLASFRDITAGQYVIHIQPLDRYRQDDARCLCHSVANGVRQCQPCLDTHSVVLTVVVDTDIKNPKTLPVATIATSAETGYTTHLTSTSTASLSASTTTEVLFSSTDYPKTQTLPVPSSQVPAISSHGEIAVRGNCSGNNRPEPLAVWGNPRSPLDCTIWNTDRCNGSLPPHLEGNVSATPPGSLSVTGVLIRDPQQNSCPQIITTWSTASNDPRPSKLKGFLLQIRRYDSVNNNTTFVCRILDFSSTRFTASDQEMKFQKKLVGFSGGSHLLYQLDLTSLPRHSPAVKLTKFFTLQPVQKGSEISANNWTPFISYDEVNVTAPATIEARFSLAPSTYNFSQYTVMLVRKGDSPNAIATCRVSLTTVYKCQGRVLQPPSENDTTVLASFINISAGEYTVHIQPVDPYSMDDSRCLCYASVANGDRMCQGCLDTVTTTFTVVQSAATINSTIVPVVPHVVEDRVASIVGSVFGAVMGVIMVITVGALRINRYLKDRDGQRFLEQWQNRNNNQGKKVILLNTDDHQYHTKVVSEFALFLHNSCGCSVSYLPWEKGKLQEEDAEAWVLNHMDESDFIIVINSRIAFDTYEARSRDRTEQSVFNTAMSHMHAKKSDDAYFKRFLFIHFSYTEERFFIKDINPAAEYQIPEQLPGLLNHIHGMQVGEDAENNVHLSLENVCDINKLQELITKSKKYEKANPRWFVSEQIQETGDAEHADNFCSVSQAGGNALPTFNTLDPHQTERLRIVQNDQFRYGQRYLAVESELDKGNKGRNVDVPRGGSTSNEPDKTRDCSALRVEIVRGILPPSDVTSDIATSQLEERLAAINETRSEHMGATVNSSTSPEFGAKHSWKGEDSMISPSDVTSDIATSKLEDMFAVLTLRTLDQVEPTVDTSKPFGFGAYALRDGGIGIEPPSDVASDTATSQVEKGLAALTLNSLGSMDTPQDLSGSPDFGTSVSKGGGISIVPPSDVASDTTRSQVEKGLAMHTLNSLESMGPTLIPAQDSSCALGVGVKVSRDNATCFAPPSDVASDTATSQLESGLAAHTWRSLEYMDPMLDRHMSAQFGASSTRDDGNSFLPPSDVASDTATSNIETGLASITTNSFGNNLTVGGDYSHGSAPRVSGDGRTINLQPSSLASSTPGCEERTSPTCHNYEYINLVFDADAPSAYFSGTSCKNRAYCSASDECPFNRH